MAEDRNSYGNIAKSIGLFGGVKAFEIIVGIIKNKIVAVLLGPSGMGIVGMLQSNLQLISSLTGFGLETSSVRDVAKAHKDGDEDTIGRIATVLRKLVIFTGLLGTFTTFFLADYLSRISFGNSDYAMSFRILSIALLLGQIKIGQTAIMQGTFHYRYMARANIWGAIMGLCVSVPLYYFFAEKAIVPVIMITYLTALFFSWFYSRKISIKSVKMPFDQIISEGKTMMILGLAIAATGVFSIGKTYLQRIIISNWGTLADVGMYTAGITIATQYVNVILSAMGSDYAPRLAAISSDNEKFILAVNRQAKLLLTLIVPLVVPLIVFVKQFTILLYSNSFMDVACMVEWMMFGMFFKALSWTMSYTIVAKGKARTFFVNESITQVYSLAFSIIGYIFGRFEGLGIGFCLTYVVYSIQMYLVCRKLYDFNLSYECKKTIIMHFVPLTFSFIILKIVGYSIIRYYLGFAIIIVLSVVSYRELNKMLAINQLIKKYLKLQ